VSLTRKLEGVTIPEVKSGPIAFGIHFSLWGGSSTQKDSKVVLPENWRKAAQKQDQSVQVPDGILPLVWDEASKPIAEHDYIPEGYALQVLEPFGGTILRPKEWFYTENHRPQNYTWTLSKENPRLGAYDTGVKIQALLGVEKHTGKTPKQFIFSFIEKKKQNAKVITECSETTAGLFTRICLETEEEITAGTISQQHRIMYSLFWGDNMDLVVISIGGTPVDSHEQYEETFNTMSSFELIDMKRFSEKQKKNLNNDQNNTTTP
jgi:hypothetical protein